MDIKKFEKKCNLCNMNIVGVSEVDDGVIVVADGYSNGTKNMTSPHYQTCFAVGRGFNNLVMAQRISHKFGAGLGFGKFKDLRAQDAFNKGFELIESMKDGEIFKCR